MKRKDAKHPAKSDCLAHWCQRIGSQVLVVLGVSVGHIQISDCILIVGRIKRGIFIGVIPGTAFQCLLTTAMQQDS